ncbi:hypothetical protein [Streptomyces brevispora]|uniref:hypothetical protein n=1 Tax=Streptomyces brevispora TaxID=887462 RepID=UPI00382304CF
MDVRTGEVPLYAGPAALRTCVVWQWLRPDECADVEAHGISSPMAISAWRRWLNARQAYAEEVDQPVTQACGPTGRPTLG